MNVYALNLTPINGNAVLFGQGAASQAVEADGRGYLVMHAAGQADLHVDANGRGIVAVLGESIADLVLSASARAYLVIHGLTEQATAKIEAIGDGFVIPWSWGIARMAIAARGIGTIAINGAGMAASQLAALARGAIAARGLGVADILITGRAGIPRPIKTPATFAHAHPSRVLRVDVDDDTARPAAPERTLTILTEDRTIHVAPERTH